MATGNAPYRLSFESPPGQGRVRVGVRLGEKPWSTRRFSPVLPPREAQLLLEGVGPRLLDRLSARFSVAVRAGKTSLPLFPEDTVDIEVAEGTRCAGRVEVGRAAGGATIIKLLELDLAPAITIHRILPVLADLPSLFEDRGLARLRSWSGQAASLALEKARDLRIRGFTLDDLRSVAGKWLDTPLGHLVPRPADLVRYAGWARASSGELARVLLRRAVATPAWRDGQWVLEPRFTGELWVGDRMSFAFDELRLPPQIIPLPHADLERLVDATPLATATLRLDGLRSDALAEAAAALLGELDGEIEMEGRAPEIGVELLLPDRSTLGVHGSLPGRLEARGRFRGHLADDSGRLSVEGLEVRHPESGRRVSLSIEGRLDDRDPAGERPVGLAARLLRAWRDRAWPSHAIAVSVDGGLGEDSHLPDLDLRIGLQHPMVKGGTELRARLREGVVEARGRLSVDPASDGEPSYEGAARVVGRLELLDDSRMDDGRTRLELGGSVTTVEARASIGSGTPLCVSLRGDADLALRGGRQVPGFPEIGIAPGEATARVAGKASFSGEARVRSEAGRPVEFDFTGTAVDLRLAETAVDLGGRALTLPPETRLSARLRSAVLGASGLGRATIEAEWSLPSSPVLRDATREIELLGPALLRRAVVAELDPAGGLSVRGEASSYDSAFFNALANPGANAESLLALLDNDDLMRRVLDAARLFSEDGHRLLEAAWRFARKARRVLDEEGVRQPADAIPGRKLAQILSRLIGDGPELADRLYPLVKQVTDGGGLDVLAVKRILEAQLGDHGYEFEIDRLTRWFAHLLAPTDPVPPFQPVDLPPLEELPRYRDALAAVPSASELYRRMADPAPLPASFCATVARLAPYLTLEQVEQVLAARRSEWAEGDLRRLVHVRELKRRVRMIADNYGGIVFAPQAMAIAFFLGEAMAMSEAAREPTPLSPDLPLADTMLGPADIAVLLQAGLASVLQERTEQLNQRMLLDHVLSRPDWYLRSVLVEMGGRSPSVLAGALNALLNLEQASMRRPLDLVDELSARLGVELPRLDDYLAGGRWAKLSYYEALSRAAEQIVVEAEPYVALRCHLQLAREDVGVSPSSPTPRGSVAPVDPVDELEARARRAVEEADAAGKRCKLDGKGRGQAKARAAYETAFAACRTLIEARPTAFQDDWLKAFWARNYEALMVLSVVRNAQEDVDDVRRWLAVRAGRDLPLGDEQALVELVVELLYFDEADRARLLADPLVRLLIDPPPGQYDLTIVSAMGVITEGARGRELETAYQRLEERRGIRTLRADTATARSLEHNAARIEEAARQVAGPWAYIGYSQGCANCLMAESRLLTGTPEQQRLAARLVSRNLLFSAFNGSAHGTCSDLKFLRAMIDGERFLKHYQAVFSRQAVDLAQRSLRLVLDSRPFVHSLLGSQSLSHDGVRFLQREGRFRHDVPTSYLRGIVEPATQPEALEWLANVLTRQIESTAHDTQVAAHEGVGHPVWVRNAQAAALRRCDMGALVQRTHHWSPLVHETAFVTTERDRRLAIYDTPKDRHVFPWVEVNARFGVIKPKPPTAA